MCKLISSSFFFLLLLSFAWLLSFLHYATTVHGNENDNILFHTTSESSENTIVPFTSSPGSLFSFDDSIHYKISWLDSPIFLTNINNDENNNNINVNINNINNQEDNNKFTNDENVKMVLVKYVHNCNSDFRQSFFYTIQFFCFFFFFISISTTNETSDDFEEIVITTANKEKYRCNIPNVDKKVCFIHNRNFISFLLILSF